MYRYILGSFYGTLEKSLILFVTPSFPLLPCHPFPDPNLSLSVTHCSFTLFQQCILSAGPEWPSPWPLNNFLNSVGIPNETHISKDLKVN